MGLLDVLDHCYGALAGLLFGRSHAGSAPPGGQQPAGSADPRLKALLKVFFDLL